MDTGQEILDEFGLQPFELLDIIAATKEGKTPSGQDVGYAAYLVQLNGTYPITDRHIEISRSMPCALRAYEGLEAIDSQREDEAVCQQGGEILSLYIGSCSPLDERIGAYYALTPGKYKTETGIDIELFYKEMPTFVFSEDEYDTIRGIVADEGLAPAEDDPAPVVEVQDAPVVDVQDFCIVVEEEKKNPGGPTKKKMLGVAGELLRGGRLTEKERRYILAFKYRETPNLPWDRAYKEIPGVGSLSKNPKTQERNFYAWATKGKKICRDHATQ